MGSISCSNWMLSFDRFHSKLFSRHARVSSLRYHSLDYNVDVTGFFSFISEKRLADREKHSYSDFFILFNNLLPVDWSCFILRPARNYL